MENKVEKAVRAWQQYVKKVTANLSEDEAVEFQEQASKLAFIRLELEDSKKGSLAYKAKELIEKVVRHCDKRKDLTMLYNVAVLATRHLNYLKFTHFELVKALAQEKRSWPVMKSTSTASTKQIEAFIKQVNLGDSQKSPLRMKAYHGSKNIFQTWALSAYTSIKYHRLGDMSDVMVPFIPTDLDYPNDCAASDGSFEGGRGRYYSDSEFHKLCIELPELTEETKDKWVVVVKYYLKLATNGHPEKDRKLRAAAGEARARRNNAPLDKGTSEANLRDDICTKVGNAFKNLVRKNP